MLLLSWPGLSCRRGFILVGQRNKNKDLLKSPSLPTTVIFLIISCFLDFTMAEVLSVSLLKKAGCWVGFGGERDTMLGWENRNLFRM